MKFKCEKFCQLLAIVISNYSCTSLVKPRCKWGNSAAFLGMIKSTTCDQLLVAQLDASHHCWTLGAYRSQYCSAFLLTTWMMGKAHFHKVCWWQKTSRSDWQAKWLCHPSDETQWLHEMGHNFNSRKCKDLPLGRNYNGQLSGKQVWRGGPGVLVDCKLNTSQQCALQVKKA